MNGSCPLSWPAGWVRTPPYSRRRAAFKRLSFEYARTQLEAELRLLRTDSTLISTNLALRSTDNLPKSGQAQPIDPGVAVYFTLLSTEARASGKPATEQRRVLACDRWDLIEHNVLAIARHIAALRGMERWGVGSIAQAFTGYAALPEPKPRSLWRLVFMFEPDEDVTREDIRARFGELAKLHHPDHGGDSKTFQALLEARACAFQEIAEIFV